MDKQTIAKNFSRCAYAYDQYADVQKKTALKLAGLLSTGGLRNILELGCGTGNYTLFLRDKFKRAKIRAIDISENMVAVAKEKLRASDIEFMVADAESISFPLEFDLITSNACLQWFEDLGNTLSRYKNMLSEGGRIYFSSFGPGTFRELHLALGEVTGNCTPASAFLPKEKLTQGMRANFRKVVIREEKYQEVFGSLRDLLKKIKYTGTRGGNGIAMSPGLLSKIEAAYLKRKAKFVATYQVFFCQGVKG